LQIYVEIFSFIIFNIFVPLTFYVWGTLYAFFAAALQKK